jgi:hypothetical protein
MSGAIVWEYSLDDMAGKLDEYGVRIMVAIDALARYFANRMQNEMRINAPWTDRSGNARTGLFSFADSAATDVVIIYLSHGHSVEYGKWLELANQGHYAIIMPTLQRMVPEIERQLKRLLAD